MAAPPLLLARALSGFLLPLLILKLFVLGGALIFVGAGGVEALISELLPF